MFYFISQNLSALFPKLSYLTVPFTGHERSISIESDAHITFYHRQLGRYSSIYCTLYDSFLTELLFPIILTNLLPRLEPA